MQATQLFADEGLSKNATKKAKNTHLPPTTLCNFMTLYYIFPHFSVTIVSQEGFRA